MIRHWPWPNLKSAIIWEDFHVLFRTVSPVSTPTGDELKEAFNNQVMCLGNVFDDCKNTGNFYHFSVYCLIFSMVTEVQFLDKNSCFESRTLILKFDFCIRYQEVLAHKFFLLEFPNYHLRNWKSVCYN